jgi:hypothetical protein
MRSSTDNGVKVCLLNCEFNPDSMKPAGLDLFQDVSDHLAMDLFSK